MVFELKWCLRRESKLTLLIRKTSHKQTSMNDFCAFCSLQLPGLISLSTKFLPTVMNIIKKLAEEGQVPATNDPRRNPALASKSFHNGVNASSEMSSTGSSEVTENDQD